MKSQVFAVSGLHALPPLLLLDVVVVLAAEVVFPEDGICDSKSERFQFSSVLPQGADNLVIIQVKDRHGNIGIHRTTF